MASRKPNKPRTHLGSSTSGQPGTLVSGGSVAEPDATTDAIPLVSAKASRAHGSPTPAAGSDKSRTVPEDDAEASEIPRVSGKNPLRNASQTAGGAAASSSKRTVATGPASAPRKTNVPKKPASKEHRRAQTRAQLSGALKAPKISDHSKEIRDAKAAKKQEVSGEPVPARTFSGKLIVWAVVGLALLAFLFPTVGTFIKQRAEIQALRESIAEKTVEQDQLKQEIARWSDPEYIKQQARDRINLVMPGERKYMVIGATGQDANVPENQSPNEVRTDLPWADALWDTVKRAATD